MAQNMQANKKLSSHDSKDPTIGNELNKHS
jgi:hypothetical protein